MCVCDQVIKKHPLLVCFDATHLWTAHSEMCGENKQKSRKRRRESNQRSTKQQMTSLFVFATSTWLLLFSLCCRDSCAVAFSFGRHTPRRSTGEVVASTRRNGFRNALHGTFWQYEQLSSTVRFATTTNEAFSSDYGTFLGRNFLAL